MEPRRSVSQVYCQRCSRPMLLTAETCGVCGTRRQVLTDAAVAASPSVDFVYAGFGVRLLAWLLDLLIATFIAIVASFLAGIVLGLGMVIWRWNIGGATQLVGWVVALPVSWLYHAILMSSRHQTTWGGMATGIVVVDMQGARISFMRATVRWVVSLFSSLIAGIGYLLMLFNDEHQTLHDMVAGTLVIKGKAE